MTLHFRPLPAACEPKQIRACRDALRQAWNHPDVAEVSAILDALSHAMLRIHERVETIADASIREALTGQHGGMTGALEDAISDVAFALECWVSDPWNEPGWMAQCDAADARIDAEKEVRL